MYVRHLIICDSCANEHFVSTSRASLIYLGLCDHVDKDGFDYSLQKVVTRQAAIRIATQSGCLEPTPNISIAPLPPEHPP